METGTKRCSKCGEVKPLDGFHIHKGGPGGRFSWCKPCANEYRRANRVRHETPEQKREQNMRSRYRLTKAQIGLMLFDQGGVCAICRKPPKRPVVDHDHSTGRVRKILCHRCNLRLSPVEDEAFRVAALAYLEAHA